MTNDTAKAVSLCIDRCARAKDGRGLWQAQRACSTTLQRTGCPPYIALNVAEAGRRIGEWLATQG